MAHSAAPVAIEDDISVGVVTTITNVAQNIITVTALDQSSILIGGNSALVRIGSSVQSSSAGTTGSVSIPAAVSKPVRKR